MKKILFSVVALVIIVVGWFILATYPRHINRTLVGKEYRAGVPSSSIKSVHLAINGTVKRSITGTLTFQGTIQVDGATQSNPDNDKWLTIHFDNAYGYGVMAYGSYDNRTPVTHTYGVIFVDPTFSQVVILENSSGWIAPNGLTIAAPASNRSQALSISNDLMKNWLKGNVLQ